MVENFENHKMPSEFCFILKRPRGCLNCLTPSSGNFLKMNQISSLGNQLSNLYCLTRIFFIFMACKSVSRACIEFLSVKSPHDQQEKI